MKRIIPLATSYRMVVEHIEGEVYLHTESLVDGMWVGSVREFAACDLLAFVKLVMALQQFEKEIILAEGE